MDPALSLRLDAQLELIMAEGFSTPRTPRGSSLCSMLLSGGVVYEEEAVLHFFCMANEALRAKTEANVVRLLGAYILFVP